MSTMPLRLAMVAGEASGDLLAGLLLGGLLERWPQVQMQGIGGPRMLAQGFETWWPQDKLAVRGYVEVLWHYREISSIREALARRLIADPPRAFIGVDAPDFNLGLEARLRARGIKTIHFVCPSIWAWRGGRAQKMATSCDHVLCLFPFEPALLQAHGVAATFVGHPMADAIALDVPRRAAREHLQVKQDETLIAVLPGSRRSEIAAIAPVFMQAVSRLQRQRKDLRFVLPVAGGLREMLEPLVQAHAPGAHLQLLDGQSHTALAACDITLIASGTATLEAALFKRPMVIGYRMNPLTWQIMKRLRYQPWVGLPNILCRDFVVPELIQENCTPETLAKAVLAGLDDHESHRNINLRFTELHHQLRCNTARQATDVIAQIVAH